MMNQSVPLPGDQLQPEVSVFGVFQDSRKVKLAINFNADSSSSNGFQPERKTETGGVDDVVIGKSDVFPVVFL